MTKNKENKEDEKEEKKKKNEKHLLNKSRESSLTKACSLSDFNMIY